MSTSIIPYERSTLVNNEKYIGLDVHQATISIAVMDSTGKVVMESILAKATSSDLLASQTVPTAATHRRRAAEAFTSERNMLRCLCMHRIC
jgi:hypothetical protein